jgi:ankyrin repeat protein
VRRSLLILSLAGILAGCGVGFVSVGSNSDRRTPLEKAAQAADLAEVQRLLAFGADPNDRRAACGSPLNAAASRANNAEVIRALVKAGANPNGRGQEGSACWSSPLQSAASLADLENTRALLDSGAAIPVSGCSKLIVGWLKPPVIDLLVPHGLNLSATDELGRNDLHLALGSGMVPGYESIEYLVHAGVPLNARDSSGRTPLAYWREPRDMERHWFRTWLIDRLVDDAEFRRQREDRARISQLLERAGAQL